MPLQRRLPKRGFKSHDAQVQRRSHAGRRCEKLGAGRSRPADAEAGRPGRPDRQDRQGHQVGRAASKAVKLKGIGATAGAKAAIEAAGGIAGLKPTDRRTIAVATNAAPTGEDRQVRRPASPAGLPAARAGGLPHRRAHSRARHRPGPAAAAVQGPAGRHPEPVQHVLGRRAVALHRVRAGHHAVHLGLDHHAAADLRRADVRAAEEGRRSRAAARSRSTRATARWAWRCSSRWASRMALEGSRRPGDQPGLRLPHDGGGQPDGRHDVPDVAGRADHRARPGQRHLDPDLRRHRRRACPAPSAGCWSWCAPAR